MKTEFYFYNPNTKVTLTENYISLSRGDHDLMINKAMRGETRIFYNQIIEIKYQKPSALKNGYIQFCTARTSNLGVLRKADQPQNAIKFSKNEIEEIEVIRKYVEATMSGDAEQLEKLSQYQPPKKKKKIGCLSIFLIAVLVFLILFFLVSFAVDSDNDKSTTTPASDSETITLDSSKTAKIDEITRNAKDAVSSGITQEQTDEAVNYIYQNYGNYFSSDDVMEQCIYYGAMLEYGYQKDYKTNLTAKTLTDLGQDVTQAVKGVYRGSDAETDEYTISNLEQIKEALIYLGYEL